MWPELIINAMKSHVMARRNAHIFTQVQWSSFIREIESSYFYVWAFFQGTRIGDISHVASLRISAFILFTLVLTAKSTVLSLSVTPASYTYYR